MILVPSVRSVSSDFRLCSNFKYEHVWSWWHYLDGIYSVMSTRGLRTTRTYAEKAKKSRLGSDLRMNHIKLFLFPWCWWVIMHYIGTMCNHFHLSCSPLHYFPICMRKWSMAEPFLKNRRRFTSSLDNKLVPLFDELSKKTRIPKSRLLDEAIIDLLEKHGQSGHIAEPELKNWKIMSYGLLPDPCCKPGWQTSIRGNTSEFEQKWGRSWG